MSKKINLDNPDGKTEFLESITAENCGEKLTLARKAMNITRRELATMVSCSEATISRIEAKKTKPTTDFMNRLLALVLIGRSKFGTLSSKEKEITFESISAIGGVGAGFGAAMAAVSAQGTVVGLSAAGVASGLSALGGTILGGAALVASVPLAAGLASLGVAKGIKAICESNKLNCTEVDGRFEITLRKKTEPSSKTEGK